MSKGQLQRSVGLLELLDVFGLKRQKNVSKKYRRTRDTRRTCACPSGLARAREIYPLLFLNEIREHSPSVPAFKINPFLPDFNPYRSLTVRFCVSRTIEACFIENKILYAFITIFRRIHPSKFDYFNSSTSPLTS